MPVLQWSLLFVLSLLLSLLFLFIHLPGPLLLGSMIVGIIFSLRGISLHPPLLHISWRAGDSRLHDCPKSDRFNLHNPCSPLADGDCYPAGNPYQQRDNRLAAGSLQ